METIKPFKPYLEKHYAVASDRADLYAYFYEKGFDLLRPGGRLGYISLATFMRSGSGEPLRHSLRTRLEIETVVDFGDLQIFEGVTTYPAIVTMRRARSANENGQEGELRFLNLQQAQLAYQPRVATEKIIYGHFAQDRIFAFDCEGYFSNDKSYFIPDANFGLLGLLNSKLVWFFIIGLSPAVRGGFYEMRVQYIERVPLPDSVQEITPFGIKADAAAAKRRQAEDAVVRRIPDLCPPGRKPKLTTRLQEWWKLDFKSFQAGIKKAFKADIPLKQRNEWESFLCEESEKVRRLSAEIEQAEREIDTVVYKLFDLTLDEIALLESSLAGQY